MAFNPSEAFFYACVFIAAGAITLFRVWRDNEPVRGFTLIGRSLSAGTVTFGVVALLLSRSADIDSGGATGGFYWLAIAALIAYYWKEIEEKALNKIIRKMVTIVLGIFGIKDDDDKRPTQ